MTANENARAEWNGTGGETWVADADHRDAVLAPVLDVLLATAAPAEGEGVLDIGCGCGATSVVAARAVGPGGRVLGLDISEPMLAVARRRAADAALGNVAFVVGDAQVDEIPAGHDLAISRFGTMFFDDAGAAFANIARGLRPGGRLCIATWQPLADNEWLQLPGSVLGFAALPGAEPDLPGMFGLSSTASIERALGPAGFRQVEVRPVDVRLPVGRDATEAAGYLGSIGLARSALEPLTAEQRSAALDELTDVLAGRVDAGGVALAAGILLTTATR